MCVCCYWVVAAPNRPSGVDTEHPEEASARSLNPKQSGSSTWDCETLPGVNPIPGRVFHKHSPTPAL